MIRKYQPRDLEECRNLWRELTEWHRKIYDDLNIGGEQPEDYFDKHLTKVGSDRLWIAVSNSKVIGLTGLIVEEEEAEIEPLIVGKEYRGKGIGKKLIERVVSEARKMEVKYLSIKPVARNVKTIKWLYRHGFQNLGHIELFMSLYEYEWKPGPELHECKFSF